MQNIDVDALLGWATPLAVVFCALDAIVLLSVG